MVLARDPGDIYTDLLPLHLELLKILSEERKPFIGQDVSVEAGGQAINPFSTTPLVLNVPVGYFTREFGEVNETALIRRFLSFDWFSTRSKLAQAGVGFRPAIPQGGSAADIPVAKVGDRYKVLIEAFSQNPKLSFKLPEEGEFPVFRFIFFPTRYRLSGFDLVKAAENLSINPDLAGLINYGGKEIPLRKCSRLPFESPFLSQGKESSLVSMAIGIEKWARFMEEREINLEVLCRAKTREEIDQVLGLDWRKSGTDLAEERQEYMIGETPKVVLPPGVAGVINLGYFNIRYGGQALHSSSVLIDPGFGVANGGMAIRTEHFVTQRIGLPRKAPKFLELFLFKVKE